MIDGFTINRIAHDEQLDFDVAREKYVCSLCSCYSKVLGCCLYGTVSRLLHALHYLSGRFSGIEIFEPLLEGNVCHSDLTRHDLKILPFFFEDVISCNKKFEIRKDDRDYKVGDIFFLNEWDPDNGYTGRSFYGQISYVLRDIQEYGLMEGYVIFGWK